MTYFTDIFLYVVYFSVKKLRSNHKRIALKLAHFWIESKISALGLFTVQSQ